MVSTFLCSGSPTGGTLLPRLREVKVGHECQATAETREDEWFAAKPAN
jgi:hypothetical protein